MNIALIALLASAVQPQDYAAFSVSNSESSRITSTEYQDCTNKPLSNYGMVQCIGEEWDKLDRQLNVNYRLALAKMPDRRSRERLRKTQCQWLRNGQRGCFEEMREVGHTPFEMALRLCEFDELIRRVAWLQRLAH